MARFTMMTLLFILELLILLVLAESSSNKILDGLENEKDEYWNRFLLNDVDTSLNFIPTPSPTKGDADVSNPTSVPVVKPVRTNEPTSLPTSSPISKPTFGPTASPVKAKEPASGPVVSPQQEPTDSPIRIPTIEPPRPRPRPCTIEVTLDCRTTGGLSCQDFPPPDTECIPDDGELVELTFRYNDLTCSGSSNSQGDKAFCSDFGNITEPATVACFSDTQLSLLVTTPTIGFGDTFTVTSNGAAQLSPSVDCRLVNASQVKIQQNVIDTTGDVPLNPGDRFGALELLTCVNTDCLENVNYSIEIRNSGDVPLEITKVDFAFNGDVENILGEVPDTSLEPGSVTSLEQQREANVCTGDDYSAKVDTEAKPIDGDICVSDASYDFTIPSSSVSPPSTSIPVPQPIDAPVPAPVLLPIIAPVVPPVTVPVDVLTDAPVSPPVEPPVIIVTPVSSPLVTPISIPVVAPIIPPSVILQCILDIKLGCTVDGTKPCDSTTLEGPEDTVDVVFSINITVPSDIDGTSATLETLVALTNFVGQLDLSTLISGRTVAPGGFVTITIPSTIDVTVRKRYTLLTTVTGETNPGGDLCSGTAFESFVAGRPAPPGVPTATPTRQPTISSAPTSNVNTANCTISTGITCQTIQNGRLSISCDQISDPRNLACSSVDIPSSLTFLYRGTKCPSTQNGFQCTDVSTSPLPNQVFITVRGGDISNRYIINFNELFTSVASYNDGVIIEISTVVNNSTGTLLQTISMTLNCADDSLVLGQTIGALDVAGFVVPEGSLSSVYSVQLTYTVTNGPIASTLQSAFVNSDFQREPFDTITSPEPLGRGAQLVVFRETKNVDALQKFDADLTFSFTMAASATAQKSGFGCQSESTYSF